MPAGSRTTVPSLVCLLAFGAGSAHTGLAAACSSDDQQCSLGPGASSRDLARKASSAARADHVLLQRGISEHRFSSRQRGGDSQGCTAEYNVPWTHVYVPCCIGLEPQWVSFSGDWYYVCASSPMLSAPAPAPSSPAPSPPAPSPPAPSPPAAECTPQDSDPWTTGSEVECCRGSRANLEQRSGGSWHYVCRLSTTPAPAPSPADACTPEGSDPWNTGSEVECCKGSHAKLEQRSGGSWHYVCRSSTTSAPAPTPAPAPAAEGVVEINLLNWNVHWTNKDTMAMANVVKENYPDIVGLCELTVSMNDMASALSAATGRDFAVQPGRSSWKGYGTDIFFDQGKWTAREGGVKTVSCPGTSGGNRAANWAVLRNRATGKLIIAGGTHLTYCAHGCDSTHECELGVLYDEIERMRSKYPSAVVVWMGDMNRSMSTTIMRNLLRGKIGSRATFAVDDLAQTQGNTYYTGGSAIDHILGEAGKFRRISGGRTGQGVKGQHLAGADHFPVRSLVRYG